MASQGLVEVSVLPEFWGEQGETLSVGVLLEGEVRK